MAGFITRPVVTGRKGVVTSGHYLATAAGFRIMENGGNAIDAAAAMCIAVDLMEPQSCGIGGEVPTLVYPANEGKVYALSGMGWSPQAFTIDWCKENDIDLIPGDGYLPITVPAVVGTWAEAVARWGNKSFSEILAPTIDLAENGYALYEGLWGSASKGGYSESSRSFTLRPARSTCRTGRYPRSATWSAIPTTPRCCGSCVARKMPPRGRAA